MKGGEEEKTQLRLIIPPEREKNRVTTKNFWRGGVQFGATKGGVLNSTKSGELVPQSSPMGKFSRRRGNYGGVRRALVGGTGNCSDT